MKIIFYVCIALQLVFVPWFLKAGWPDRTNKSTLLKCTCSVLFTLTAILGALIGGNIGNIYAILMIIGFVMSLLGDFFLDREDTPRNFLCGLLSFFSAHCLYLSAYFVICGKLFGYYINVYEIIGIVAIFAMFVALKFILKINLGEMAIPVAAYSLIITSMLVKATSLGIQFIRNDLPNAWPVLTVLALGSILFATSDAILSLMQFDGKFTKNMRIANIYTYFAGQVLLAVSVLWIVQV